MSHDSWPRSLGIVSVALEVRLLVMRGLGARLRVPASLYDWPMPLENDTGTSGGVGIVRTIRQCNRQGRFSVDRQIRNLRGVD